MNYKLLSMVLVVVGLAGCGGEPVGSESDGVVDVIDAAASHGDELKGPRARRDSRRPPKGEPTTSPEPEPTPEPAPEPVPEVYALKLTDARHEGLAPAWKSSFDIYSTYELMFATEVPASLTGKHTLTVFVKMPGEMDYQRFDVTFVTDGEAGAGEQKAELTATGYRVWVGMPVAGTMIDQYALAGDWTADAHVDGVSKATAGLVLN
jgi:hypothetical protein